MSTARSRARGNRKGKTLELIAYGILCLGITAACSPKEAAPKPESETLPPSNMVEQVESKPESAAPVFRVPPDLDNETDRHRFNQLRNRYADYYNPPYQGSSTRVDQKNGYTLEGDFMRYTPEGIALGTSDGISMISRDNMTRETRLRLFADELSEFLAAEQVRAENKAGRQLELDYVYFNPETIADTETRIMTVDRVAARRGPGAHFIEHDQRYFYRGQKIDVLHETNGWICARVEGDASAPYGWIPKFSSFITNPDDEQAVEREVKKLYDTGFLIAVEPRKYQALVDVYVWRTTDSASLVGKCKLLGIYSAQKRGSKLIWIKINDALSGQRLAEYSGSKGFKEFR